MSKYLLTVLFLLTGPFLRAQVIGDLLEDETVLYAETKQVNQFFRRFNSEEDGQGEKIYPGNPAYRDNYLRKQTLPLIFDQESTQISKNIKASFIKDVTDSKDPVYLDFHGGEWFAEVVVNVIYKGVNNEAHLFLKLQEEPVGSKWVLTQVYFKPFTNMFFKDPDGTDKFLHPLSHELDFMNLGKVFRVESQVEYYTYQNFVPDFLSIFIYELKMERLQFVGVKKVNFHFFQVEGYYFKLEEFNRSGFNNGWLITKLDEIDLPAKNQILNDIYYEETK
jgi:hypothetical protein